MGAGGGVASGADPVAAHLGVLAGLSTSSGGSSDEEGVDGNLGLGELAQLTVNNEAEVSYDVSFPLLFLTTDYWNGFFNLKND